MFGEQELARIGNSIVCMCQQCEKALEDFWSLVPGRKQEDVPHDWLAIPASPCVDLLNVYQLRNLLTVKHPQQMSVFEGLQVEVQVFSTASGRS